MEHELEGCALKLQRALFHIQALNEAIKGFRQSETHGLIREDDPKTGEGVWYLDVPDHPPVTWSPVVGDILHNLHSTLDHLTWRLAVRANYGHEPDSSTRATFPIFKQRSRFWKKGKRSGKQGWGAATGATALLTLPGDARRLVLAVQPYKNGNRAESHPLWHLHTLSNEDKHKTLHVVQAAIVDYDLEIVKLEDVRIDHFTPRPGSIQGRTEIGRVGVTQIGPNPKCHLKPKFALAEAFAEGTPLVAGQYVGEVLGDIFEYIQNEVFVRRFAPYFGIPQWAPWWAQFLLDHEDEYPL